MLRKLLTESSKFYWGLINKDKTYLKIAIVSSGGIGDALIFLNYAKYLSQWIDCPAKIDFYHKKSIILNLYNNKESWLNETYDSKKIKFTIGKYDLVIEFHYRFPKIVYCRVNRLKKFSRKLPFLVSKYNEFNFQHQFIINYSPKTDGLSCDFSLGQNKNRVTQPDIFSILGISDTIISPPVAAEENTLKKYNLIKNNFILINRSVDSSNNSQISTKLWPAPYYEKLIEKIKIKNNKIKIVAVGPRSEIYLGDVLDLRGKTSFNELKVLLKNAYLLISSEGGMVHLRHALGKKISCVLFGPTSKEFFGYPENINISSSICKLNHCEWLVEDWQNRCVSTNTSFCKKLQNITPTQVYEKIENIL